MEKARELDDNDFEVHRILAEVKLSQENFKDAEKHARKCFKLVPNDPRVLSVYGEILVRVGQIDKGLEAIENAYKLTPIASGKTNEDHRLSSILLGNFMARNKKSCIQIISKLENIDFRSWILTAKICNDEEYDYKSASWFIFGKNNFSEIHWKEEILRFKLNNNSITKALINFANGLFA